MIFYDNSYMIWVLENKFIWLVDRASASGSWRYLLFDKQRWLNYFSDQNKQNSDENTNQLDV